MSKYHLSLVALLTLIIGVSPVAQAMEPFEEDKTKAGAPPLPKLPDLEEKKVTFDEFVTQIGPQYYLDGLEERTKKILGYAFQIFNKSRHLNSEWFACKHDGRFPICIIGTLHFMEYGMEKVVPKVLPHIDNQATGLQIVSMLKGLYYFGEKSNPDVFLPNVRRLVSPSITEHSDLKQICPLLAELSLTRNNVVDCAEKFELLSEVDDATTLRKTLIQVRDLGEERETLLALAKELLSDGRIQFYFQMEPLEVAGAIGELGVWRTSIIEKAKLKKSDFKTPYMLKMYMKELHMQEQDKAEARSAKIAKLKEAQGELKKAIAAKEKAERELLYFNK